MSAGGVNAKGAKGLLIGIAKKPSGFKNKDLTTNQVSERKSAYKE
jgi:hypothetical protein